MTNVTKESPRTPRARLREPRPRRAIGRMIAMNEHAATSMDTNIRNGAKSSIRIPPSYVRSKGQSKLECNPLVMTAGREARFRGTDRRVRRRGVK